jgi:hypothetical protein
MFRNQNFISTKFSILVVFLLYVGLLDAQWAGSSSPAGSSNVNTSVMKSNSSSGATKVYLGLGLGGYSSSLVKSAVYQYPYNWIAGNLIDQKVGKTSGVNCILGFLGKTKTQNLSTGIEMGLGYHSKDIDYTYFDNFGSGIITRSGNIRSLHVGIGVPIRYTFVQKSDVEAYFQGVFGYGYVDIIDDQYESYMDGGKGVFYGGGAIGGRASIFFAELGYNSTGYLRFGMAF